MKESTHLLSQSKTLIVRHSEQDTQSKTLRATHSEQDTQSKTLRARRSDQDAQCKTLRGRHSEQDTQSKCCEHMYVCTHAAHGFQLQQQSSIVPVLLHICGTEGIFASLCMLRQFCFMIAEGSHSFTKTWTMARRGMFCRAISFGCACKGGPPVQ